MTRAFPGAVVGALILLSGCATERIPGGSGEVSGPLQSIDFFAAGSPLQQVYPTAFRERFYASDREILVYSTWHLPGTDEHTCGVVLRTPGHAIHQEGKSQFRTKGPYWATGLVMRLPEGEVARPLEGRWSVEVSLDGKQVGERTFTFDPGSIRLRTGARLLILPGKQDFEAAAGDYIWLQEYGARESGKTALTLLRLALRDELARRFPHVELSGPAMDPGKATVLLTPMLAMSPNTAIEPRLSLVLTHVPTQTVRWLQWRTSVGHNVSLTSGSVNFALAALDLANQSASSPDLLDFLRTVTQATSE
ncbi:MAG TPA: hypothetical protein VLH58_10425 [Candidatus Methylomirabilis sp.]|nr:hypothetical protein [Candidatus Methylomirabilis sp.]